MVFVQIINTGKRFNIHKHELESPQGHWISQFKLQFILESDWIFVKILKTNYKINVIAKVLT